MDRHDFHLGFSVAYVLAIGLHLALAWLIRTRTTSSSETRLFAAANIALAGWQVSQILELLSIGQVFGLSGAPRRSLASVQMLLLGLVLALFFHLLCTFERVYRRRAPSLRAAITTELHRRERFWVPAAYLSVVLGAALYLGDAGGEGWPFAQLRASIGPTSAYLFGGVLFFMTFVMFPARAGQERIVVPAVARALLLLSLATSVALVALWHDSHPARTSMVALPWLHLHSVAFVIFLALVRYEFRFMDGFIRETLRVLGWLVVVGVAYFLFNRAGILNARISPFFVSVTRVAVLLAGVALAPWVGRRLARFADRLLLAREVELESYVHTLAGRMAHSSSLEKLVQAAAGDIAHAVHSKKVHIVVGSSAKAREAVREHESSAEGFRLRVPMGDPEEPNGWILLGERRNLYPYFDGEHRFLNAVGELLGGAIHAIRTRPRPAPPEPQDKAETDAELERLRHALSFTRRELRGERERFDPEMVGDVLAIAGELGEENPDAALGVVRSLERVLRHALSEPLGRSSLAFEMAFARDYLALEKLRLRNRLEVDLSFDPALRDQVVPHRLLQPLIENALSHGLRRELRIGKIRIHASLLGEDADRVELQVEDNGAGFPSSLASDPTEGEGGIGRVTHWLRRMFGEECSIRIDPGSEVGSVVTLRFPLRLDEERAGSGAEL